MSLRALCFCVLPILLCPIEPFSLVAASGFAAPAPPSRLSVDPPAVSLSGSDASTQIVLTAKDGSGRLADLIPVATFTIANPKIARISPKGRITPLANGSTTLKVETASGSAEIPVSVADFEDSKPISFANEIVPVLTKFGCNAGGCHGKISGQNGFRLSLLGFDPEFDYTNIVKEGRGRRLSPSAPEKSALLLKATGAVGHGGGKKIDPESDEYKLLRRWIVSGVNWGSKNDPTLVSIEVRPSEQLLSRKSRQQIRVVGKYSDKSVRDITRRVQYESNQPEIASVDVDGLVRTHSQTGEAGIMARYQGQVVVFRGSVPMENAVPKYAFAPKNFIDRELQKQWNKMNIAPSPAARDEEWLRRVYLDLTGSLPTPSDLNGFLSDKSPDRDGKVVDNLLASEEHSAFFAQKWSDILRVKRGNQIERARGTFLFYDWIKESIATDKPYDKFLREIVTARGEEANCPPVVWYKDLLSPDQFVDNMSQVFLGSRLQCAQCHHHPFEKWSQDDYWGMAAFFGRVARKSSPIPGQFLQNNNQIRQIVYLRNTGSVINKRTNKVADPKPLDSTPVETDPDLDPRQQLVDWMVAPENPFVAKAVVNRYWSYFFTRGIVDPIDDFRVTNPPSNPELLDALAKDLIANKWSLRHTIRQMVTSAAYRLSSDPTKDNEDDKQSFARHYPRRMSAEVMLDAVCLVTGSPATFNGLPTDAHAPRRAIMLPDESYQSYFLDVFGRPQRQSACECERIGDANLAQILHMLNSDEVQTRLSRIGSRADLLAKDPRPADQKVRELFLWALGHEPDAKKLAAALEHIKENEKDPKLAYENILWALINTKEFAFIR